MTTLSRWRLGVPSLAVGALVLWRCGSPTSPTPTCAYNTAVSASHCGCDVGSPIDLGVAKPPSDDPALYALCPADLVPAR